MNSLVEMDNSDSCVEMNLVSSISDLVESKEVKPDEVVVEALHSEDEIKDNEEKADKIQKTKLSHMNFEELKEYQKKQKKDWQKENADKMKIYCKRYYLKNKEKYKYKAQLKKQGLSSVEIREKLKDFVPSGPSVDVDSIVPLKQKKEENDYSLLQRFIVEQIKSSESALVDESEDKVKKNKVKVKKLMKKKKTKLVTPIESSDSDSDEAIEEERSKKKGNKKRKL